MQFSKSARKIWKTFFDLILPADYNRRVLDGLSAEKFLALAEPARWQSAGQEQANTLAIVNYKNRLVKQAVWSLKFKNNRALAELFAAVIYDELKEELADLRLIANFSEPLLTPVPLARRRLNKRGYNQAELIARHLAKLDQNNFFEYRKHILKKIKDTLPQSQIKNKAQRLKNLKGCFTAVAPALIKNRNIILLDDVTTTGATLNEASRALRRAGARQIFCVTLAH
ncbi:MAG: ComF family protein [Candidatus Pacebacteria bacterium]|nr:ComF family protein [Candidatus Paceibacterota bacterium]